MFGIDRRDFNLIRDNLDLIENNLDKDPSSLALSGIDRAICTQIKYLSRCKSKLPHYYSKRCIIPPISYEQCSSLHTASIRDYFGDRCLDLTCGMGVDSFEFSKKFKTVVSIERDTLLCDIAKENFKRLGANNIEIINEDSDLFVKNYQGDKFDMIFIDPARRDEKERVFLFERSSPNVIELLPTLKKIGKRIIIKSSPMFDIDEAFRVFGDECNIEILSLNGECKELIIDISENSCHTISASIIKNDNKFDRYSFKREEDKLPDYSDNNPEDYSYALIPDVAFIKGRLTESLFSKYMPNSNPLRGSLPVALCNDTFENLAVRSYAIESIMEYHPKKILAYLKDNKIGNATIIKRRFPHSIEEIRKSLKLKDGSQKTLIATMIGNKSYVIIVIT